MWFISTLQPHIPILKLWIVELVRMCKYNKIECVLCDIVITYVDMKPEHMTFSDEK